MKKQDIILFICVFTVITIVTLWQWSGREDSNVIHQEGSSVITKQADVATELAKHNAQSSAQANKQKPTEASKSLSAVPTSIPSQLKPLELLASDQITSASGDVIVRSVVSTDTALGKILVVENPESDFPEIYSAEHLVVTTADQEQLSDLLTRLQKAGFDAAKPYADSTFLYLTIQEHSPAGIDQSLDIALGILSDTEGVVELDGVGFAGAVPNDPSYHLQWNHQNIQSEPAWDMTQGNSSIVVAVLDTGINTTLTEFSGRIVSGYDYANNDSDPADDQGHGTKVASVIAATGNNGTDIAGVDWNCGIMPVKVLHSSGTGYYSWWASGVDFARTNGANVINLSAGGGGSSSSLTNAINNALNADIVFVTITHNDGTSTITYPGNLPQVITVGATDRNDTRAYFSNWGPEIDLVAPGTGSIITLDINGALSIGTGTSYAAPQVAGAAALLLSLDPNLTESEVADLLISGVDDVGSTGFDEFYGWGRLNIYNSLSLVTPIPVEFIEVAWTRNNGWDIATFAKTFNDPIVVASPLSYNGEDPSHVRVQNVTATGFEYQVEEWAYLDGNHTADEVIQFMVVERGVHRIGNKTWEAGSVPLRHNFKSVTLDPSFRGNQTILTQTATVNDATPVVVRIRNVNSNQFEMRLQEEEAENQTHVNESVHYIAIQRGTGTEGNMRFKANKTGATVTDATTTINFGDTYTMPFFFAQIRTFNGGDPSGLRVPALNNTQATLFVEEEQSLDTEKAHNNEEIVTWIVIEVVP